jgi:diguanylate cyclase (GGDEF)-like protein
LGIRQLPDADLAVESMESAPRSTLSRAFGRVEAVSDRELMMLTAAFLWILSGIATLLAGLVNPDLVPDPKIYYRVGCAAIAAFVSISLFTWMPKLDDVRLMRQIYFWAAVSALIHAVLMFGQPVNISSLYVGLIAPAIFVACFLNARATTFQIVLITLCLVVPAAISYKEVLEEHVLSRTVAFAPIVWVVAASVFLLQRNRLRALERVDTLAGTDPLTGVANLHRFERRGSELLDPRNARIARPTGLLLIDLDDFKTINTEFGHAGGDLALREVGAALTAAALPGQLVARIGGDEFAVLIENADTGALDSLCAHYAYAIGRIEGLEQLGGRPIAATIGAAVSPEDGSDLDALKEAADRSMYARKAVATLPARPAAPASAVPEEAAPARRQERSRPTRPTYNRLAATGWIAAATIGLIGLAMPDAVRGDLTVTLLAVCSGYPIALLAWFSAPPARRWQWIRNDAIALLWIAWVAYLTGGAYSALWPLVVAFIVFEAWVLDSRRTWFRVPGAIAVVLAPLVYSELSSISKPTGAALYAGVLGILGMTLVLSFLQDHRERAERESKRLSTIDPRTSLLNRREFERRAKVALNPGGELVDVAIAMLDLDHFKDVNTEHGHATGDQLLEQIGAALAACTREEDSLARIGGDEFAVILLGVDRATAARLAERYVSAVDEAAAENELAACRAVSATAGVAVFGEDGMSLDELLTNADRELMAEKSRRDARAEAAVTPLPESRIPEARRAPR